MDLNQGSPSSSPTNSIRAPRPQQPRPMYPNGMQEGRPMNYRPMPQVMDGRPLQMNFPPPNQNQQQFTNNSMQQQGMRPQGQPRPYPMPTQFVPNYRGPLPPGVRPVPRPPNGAQSDFDRPNGAVRPNGPSPIPPNNFIAGPQQQPIARSDIGTPNPNRQLFRNSSQSNMQQQNGPMFIVRPRPSMSDLQRGGSLHGHNEMPMRPYVEVRPRPPMQVNVRPNPPYLDMQMQNGGMDPNFRPNMRPQGPTSPEKRKFNESGSSQNLGYQALAPPANVVGRRNSINYDPDMIPKFGPGSSREDSSKESEFDVDTGSFQDGRDSGGARTDDARPTFIATLRRKQTSPAQELARRRDDAANSNDPKVLFEFAKACLAAGEDHIEEGFTLLKKIANSGYPEAHFFLGDAFADDGKDSMAYAQYLMAAKRGYAPACHAIGMCAETGRGCKKNSRLALEMYNKAATSGDLDSMYRLGLAEMTGTLGLRPDIAKAVKWFKRACAVPNREHPEPLYQLAKIYEVGYPPYVIQDLNYARGVLQEAADFGYPPALYKMGYSYEHGLLGLEPNAAESIRLYTEAINAGDPEGFLGMAGWYMTGVDGLLPKNEEKAFQLVKQAADNDLPRGLYTLGYFYEEGIGTRKDVQMAMKQYEAAAERGDQRSISRLEEQGIKVKNSKSSKKTRSIFGFKF